MKKIIDFIIKEKRILNADMFLLVLYSPELPHIKAGQFVNVKVDGEPSTFLRRPISVHNVDEDKGLLYLLIKIAGKGTMQLSKLQKGEKLNIILPLGNGFTAPVGQHCLLIGGGVGIAPLLHCKMNMKNTQKYIIQLKTEHTESKATLPNILF